MRASRGFSHAILAGLLIACLGLAACGRKGPLEAPPGAIDTTPAVTGQAAGYPAGQPAGGPPTTTDPAAVPPEPPRRFFLDFLL